MIIVAKRGLPHQFVGKLKESAVKDKNGLPIINKTRQAKTALNFPKSSKNDVFVRGSGIDSSKKPLNVNGIDMYEQCLWVKGKYIVMN